MRIILFILLCTACHPQYVDERSPKDNGRPDGESTPEEEEDDFLGTAPEVKLTEPTYENVQRWSDRYCLTCHILKTEANSGAILMDLRDSIRDPRRKHQMVRYLIEPGRPEASIFLTIIDPKKTRRERLMPPGIVVPKKDREVIAAWIASLPRNEVDPQTCVEDPFYVGCACEIDRKSEECFTLCENNIFSFECEDVLFCRENPSAPMCQ